MCFVENALGDRGLFSVSAKDGKGSPDILGTVSKRVNIALSFCPSLDDNFIIYFKHLSIKVIKMKFSLWIQLTEIRMFS